MNFQSDIEAIRGISGVEQFETCNDIARGCQALHIMKRSDSKM